MNSLVAGSIFLLIVVVAGFGAWMSIYAAPKVAGPDAPIPGSAVAQTRPATIESSVEAATTRALEWDSDARLFAATVQFDFAANPSSDSSGPIGGWLVFVFVRGDGSSSEALTLMVERNRGEILRESARSLGAEATGLDLGQVQTIAVDSFQALTIAEAERGLEFRAACLRYRHVARLSFHPGDQESKASWVVSYNDARITNGPLLRIVVDAQSGLTTVSEFGAPLPDSVDLSTCPE